MLLCVPECMSLFSHDLVKMEVDQLFMVLELFTCVQYSYGAWFLDGRLNINTCLANSVYLANK